MYPLETSSLLENSVVDGDLYDQEGNIILLRGTRLRPRIIDFLRSKGIERVFLLTDDRSPIREVQEDNQLPLFSVRDICLEKLLQRHDETGTIPREILDEIGAEVHALFKALLRKGKINVEPLRSAALRAVDTVLSLPHPALKLNDLVFLKNDLPTHSINAAIVSLFAGRTFDLDRDQLLTLTLGALLHDVGLLELGLDGMQNNSLAFAESINPVPASTHPETGVRLLSQKGIRDEAILDIVYNHHERHDGLGYPRRLKDSEIPLRCALATLADDFVTLSSMTGPGGLSPASKVMGHIIRDIGKAYAPDAARGFVRTVGIYPVGSLLLLTNGETGMVIANPSGDILTPLVMLFRNPKGEETVEPACLDLAESSGVYVRKVLGPADRLRFGDGVD